MHTLTPVQAPPAASATHEITRSEPRLTNSTAFKMTALLLTVALGALLLAGCSTGEKTAADAGAELPQAAPAAMQLGTLPTRAALPLWVAQEKGYLAEAGLPKFEVLVFASAQERDAAFAAGEIDAVAGELADCVALEAAGSGITLATVMLAADGTPRGAASEATASGGTAPTVLGIADAFMRAEGGTQAVDAMLEAWDRAVADINAAPEEFRPLLADKAQLPEATATDAAVGAYPAHALPAKADIDAVLTSMKAEGRLKDEVTYEDLTLVMPE